MSFLKTVFVVAAFGFLAACSTSGGGNSAAVDASAIPSMRVASVSVVVPRSLRASEENSYKPNLDIVWREDPLGDRYAQVKTIFETAMARGKSQIRGDMPVNLDIQVASFHALTHKTRSSIGGTHYIAYHLTARNAKTGAIVVPTHLVKMEFEAYGGRKAVEAVRAGQTQKVRIIAHLTQSIIGQIAPAQLAAMSK